MKRINLKTPNAELLKDMTLDEILDTKMLFVLAQDFETAAEVRDWERKITGYKPPKINISFLDKQMKLLKKQLDKLHKVGFIEIPIKLFIKHT